MDRPWRIKYRVSECSAIQPNSWSSLQVFGVNGVRAGYDTLFLCGVGTLREAGTPESHRLNLTDIKVRRMSRRPPPLFHQHMDLIVSEETYCSCHKFALGPRRVEDCNLAEPGIPTWPLGLVFLAIACMSLIPCLWAYIMIGKLISSLNRRNSNFLCPAFDMGLRISCVHDK